MKRLRDFFLYEFPSLFQKTLPLTLLSFFIFSGAFFLSFIWCLLEGEDSTRIVQEKIVYFKEILPQGVESPFFLSSFIVMNNMRVVLLAFAGGLLFGIGTCFVLIYNGVLLGALFSVLFRSGEGIHFLAFILPHGVVELPSIFIAGGAGLLLAKGLILPGGLSRKDALITNGKMGLKLIVGIIPLIITAALIESFFTPLKIVPDYIKLIFSAITVIFLLLYLFFKSPPKALP